MPDVRSQNAVRFTFLCRSCHQPVTASGEWVGREVRCAHCSAVQTVPEQTAAGAEPPTGDAPKLTAKRYFNFVCKRCSSVLEAHTGICGKRGHCPTCDAFFVIPHVDPRTGLPTGEADPGDDGQDPTPVHAYAASGDQAPQIVRGDNGEPAIKCPRCNAHNSLDANSCEACGRPFTLEGASVARGRYDAQGLASLGLGLLALPLCMFFVPGVLAITVGWLRARETPGSPWPPLIRAGVALGGLSLAMGVVFWLFKL